MVVSFRDSKEIMVTSGSENKLKYTKINFTRSPRTYTRPPLSWIKQDSNSTAQDSDKSIQNTCGLHQLRCVSGKCINVDQLCDKVSCIYTYYFHCIDWKYLPCTNRVNYSLDNRLLRWFR